MNILLQSPISLYHIEILTPTLVLKKFPPLWSPSYSLIESSRSHHCNYINFHREWSPYESFLSSESHHIGTYHCSSPVLKWYMYHTWCMYLYGHLQTIKGFIWTSFTMWMGIITVMRTTRLNKGIRKTPQWEFLIPTPVFGTIVYDRKYQDESELRHKFLFSFGK